MNNKEPDLSIKISLFVGCRHWLGVVPLVVVWNSVLGVVKSLNSWVYHMEKEWWVKGENKHADVAVWELRGKIEFTEDLVWSVNMTMVV